MIRDLGLPDHNGQTIVLFADGAPNRFWGKDLGIGATEGQFPIRRRKSHT